MLLLSPLEQFQILSLVTIKIFGFDFSITNAILINIVSLLCFSGTIYFFGNRSVTLFRKTAKLAELRKMLKQNLERRLY